MRQIQRAQDHKYRTPRSGNIRYFNFVQTTFKPVLTQCPVFLAMVKFSQMVSQFTCVCLYDTFDVATDAARDGSLHKKA